MRKCSNFVDAQHAHEHTVNVEKHGRCFRRKGVLYTCLRSYLLWNYRNLGCIDIPTMHARIQKVLSEGVPL